jgi:hypothetical protein
MAAIRLWSWTARRPRLYALATTIAVRFLRFLGGRDGMIGTLPFGGEWTRGRFFPAPKSHETFRSLYAARPKRPSLCPLNQGFQPALRGSRGVDAATRRSYGKAEDPIQFRYLRSSCRRRWR